MSGTVSRGGETGQQEGAVAAADAWAPGRPRDLSRVLVSVLVQNPAF